MNLTYTDMGPIWTGLVVTGDKVISPSLISDHDILYIMMDYLQK